RRPGRSVLKPCRGLQRGQERKSEFHREDTMNVNHVGGARGRARSIAGGIVAGLLLTTLSVAPALAQKFEATLASVNGPDYINPRMQKLFIEKVKEYTNGNVVIEWVGSGQLGGLKENLEAIMAGNLEMAGVANANLGPISPGPMLFDLPFIFRDYD